MEMGGAVFILWPTMKHYGWISGHRMNGENAIFILWPIDGKDSLPLSQARFSGPCRRHEGVRGMCPRGKRGGMVAANNKKAPGVVRHSGLKVGGNLLSHLV